MSGSSNFDEVIPGLRAYVESLVRQILSPPGQEPAELTVPQAGKLAGVKPRTVREWIRGGKLPAHEVNGRYRVNRSDLDRYISTPALARPKTRKPDEKTKRSSPDQLGALLFKRDSR